MEKYSYRAKCVRVVDGDTVDLRVDVGFHMTFTGRFRLSGINAPELRSKDAAERALAKSATDKLVELLKPSNESTWDLRVVTEKSDDFGRWLATVYIHHDLVSVNDELLKLGLAVPYKG